MDLQQVGRALLVAAFLIGVVGGLLLLGGALGLGRLPGDLAFTRGRARVYVPLATSVVLSIVATVLLNLFLRR